MILDNCKKKDEEKMKKIEDNAPEKINKFDIFKKKAEAEQKKPNLSKEERAQKTKEIIMNKLIMKKSKNAEAANNNNK